MSEWKKEEVKKLKELLKEYNVCGIVNINDIPSKQMQQVRSKLGDKATLRVTRNTLMKIALEENDMKEYVKENVGFIFANMDSFKLYKTLEEGKAPAPAKGGEIAHNDIIVEKGDTGFPPGPMIGELQGIQVPAKVQKGTIHVQKDTIVVKEGETISKEMADILTKLKIEPREVGFDLVGTYEDGMIFLPDVLKVDTGEIKNNMSLAYNNAMNLALYAGIVNKETIGMLIGKTHREAISLALELNVVNKDTVKIILGKAYRNALAVSSKIE